MTELATAVIEAAQAPELATAPGLTVSEFAQRIGVRERTLQQALRRGRIQADRLQEMDGVLRIVDPEGAAKDFHRHQDAQKARWPMVARERARLLRQQTRKLRLANAERERKLVNRDEIENLYAQKVVTVRDKLLSVPARFKLHVPEVTDAGLIVLDQLIRETLEELS